MSSGVQFNISIQQGNSSSVMDGMMAGLKSITDSVNRLNSHFLDYSRQSIDALKSIQTPIRETRQGFDNCTSSLMKVQLATQGFAKLSEGLDAVIEPGARLNASMLELSAITGVTGKKLDEIEMAARASAKTFGNDAAQSVESYKLILSKLDPEIANNSIALKAMGDNVANLSKSMNGDMIAATTVLTTAMNQYGISTKDPIMASRQMAEMMNIMSAGAQAGSAELPELKNALEACGMMAKTANLSFAETNAAIQVLDKKGKSGAEGGVALRNMLGIISQGEYMHKKSREILELEGISVSKLADNNLSLSQRLQMLKPIMNDVSKMGAVFGEVNVQGAMALVQNIDLLDDYKGKIVNTSSAFDQAKTNMTGYQQGMNRIKAVIDDVKISFFNLTKEMLPQIQMGLKSIQVAGSMASGYVSIATVYEGFTKKCLNDEIKTIYQKIAALSLADIKSKASAAIQAISTGVTWLHVKAVNAWRNATLQAVAANEALSRSILGIPGFGWIVAAVAAISGAVIYLWETSRGFRETLFGLWEAAKAVFSNIGTIVMRVWELVIKPIFGAIKTVAVAAFSGIWVSVKMVFGWIVDIFKWHFNVAVMIWKGIYDTIVAVVGFIWTAIVSVGNVIADFFGGIWVAIGSIFKGVGQFINEWLIQPINSAFGGLWNTITEMFNKIMEKMKALFAPIVAIWNEIFGKDVPADVGAAYEEGKKKGGESFDKDQADKKKQEASGGAASPVAGLSALQSSGISLAGTAMGAKAASGAKEKAGKESGSVAGGTKTTTVNLTIQKLIGIETLKTTNIQAAASQAGEHVVNLVLEALQGVNGKLSMD